MSIELSNYQKQELGNAIYRAGLSPEHFIKDETGADTLSLKSRESSDVYTIGKSSDSTRYTVQCTTPGTSRIKKFGSMTWSDVVSYFETWTATVKQENEAVDPWAQETEGMADDDSYFNVNDLPKVDRAIEDSLNNLRDLAINQGVSQKRAETELHEIKILLEKSARTSTKREWINLFKGLIIGKLVDWGMQTELFSGILHILIDSAHDIAQLTEHASKHL